MPEKKARAARKPKAPQPIRLMEKFADGSSMPTERQPGDDVTDVTALAKWLRVPENQPVPREGHVEFYAVRLLGKINLTVVPKPVTKVSIGG